MCPIWSWLHKFIHLLIHTPTTSPWSPCPYDSQDSGCLLQGTSVLISDQLDGLWAQHSVNLNSFLIQDFYLYHPELHGALPRGSMKDLLSQFHHILRVSLFCLAFFPLLVPFWFPHFHTVLLWVWNLLKSNLEPLGLISTLLLIHRQITVPLCQVTFRPQWGFFLFMSTLISHALKPPPTLSKLSKPSWIVTVSGQILFMFSASTMLLLLSQPTSRTLYPPST